MVCVRQAMQDIVMDSYSALSCGLPQIRKLGIEIGAFLRHNILIAEFRQQLSLRAIESHPGAGEVMRDHHPHPRIRQSTDSRDHFLPTRGSLGKYLDRMKHAQIGVTSVRLHPPDEFLRGLRCDEIVTSEKCHFALGEATACFMQDCSAQVPLASAGLAANEQRAAPCPNPMSKGDPTFNSHAIALSNNVVGKRSVSGGGSGEQDARHGDGQMRTTRVILGTVQIELAARTANSWHAVCRDRGDRARG
jgi:hypothetical protein